MLDWVNIALRTVMCLAFIVLVVRPMMLSLVRREPSQEALEELAESAVDSAFKAWRQNETATPYYLNPQLALLVAENPNMAQVPPEPTPQEKAQAEAEAKAAEEAQLAEQASQETSAQAAAEGASGAAAKAAVTTTADGQSLPEGAVALAATDVASTEDAAEDEDLAPDEQLKQMRERMKQEQKKAKPTIPTELLNNANSYEDKLALVRMIVSQEHDRVAATIKRMVQAG